MKSLNIAIINIEQDRHLDRVLAFIKQRELAQRKPEVLLLQEVFEKDLAYLEVQLGMKSAFAVLNYLRCDTGDLKLGVATFSSLPILKSTSIYYRGDGANPPYIKYGEPEKMARALLLTEIAQGEQKHCLANTHFTWSANATPNAEQQEDLAILLRTLAGIPEFILGGDFNSPRGKVIFDTLAAKYRDNIPLSIKSTLDQNLHLAGHLNLVVDGLFSTPGYKVKNIEVVSNVSDHCAIAAEISMAAPKIKSYACHPE